MPTIKKLLTYWCFGLIKLNDVVFNSAFVLSVSGALSELVPIISSGYSCSSQETSAGPLSSHFCRNCPSSTLEGSSEPAASLFSAETSIGPCFAGPTSSSSLNDRSDPLFLCLAFLPFVCGDGRTEFIWIILLSKEFMSTEGLNRSVPCSIVSVHSVCVLVYFFVSERVSECSWISLFIDELVRFSAKYASFEMQCLAQKLAYSNLIFSHNISIIKGEQCIFHNKSIKKSDFQ